MNGFDAFVIILILIGAYRGYKSGFLMEIVSLLAIVLGLFAGFKLVRLGITFLEQKTEINNAMLPYIAFASIFVLVVVLVLWLGKMLKGSFEKSLFGSIDQALGALVGILKTTFMLSVLLWIVDSFHSAEQISFIKNSVLYPYIVDVASYVTKSIGRLIPMFKNVF